MKKQELKEKLVAAKIKLKIYKKGYGILAEYFDCISDEEKPKVHKRLTKLGL
jgi:hypothetical protein